MFIVRNYSKSYLKYNEELLNQKLCDKIQNLVHFPIIQRLFPKELKVQSLNNAAYITPNVKVCIILKIISSDRILTVQRLAILINFNEHREYGALLE